MYNNRYNNIYNNSNSKQNNPDSFQSDNHDNIAENDKLKNIDPIKLKIITEIRNKSKGMTAEEILPQILKINDELNRRGLNFTKEETSILMTVIEESLDEKDRQKFNLIKSFF